MNKDVSSEIILETQRKNKPKDEQRINLGKIKIQFTEKRNTAE